MIDQQTVATNYRKVQVVFRKSVSDGNYGTEAAEVYLEDYLGPDSDIGEDEDAANHMLSNARALVHAELSRSPSARVRQALTPPKPTVVDDDDDDMPLDWQRSGA